MSLGGLLACARGPLPEAAHYPTLPALAGPAPGVAAFEPSSTLQMLPLSCRAAELPVANALDDDCNGRVDDGLGEDAPAVADPQSLRLSFSYPQTARLRVSVQRDDKSLLELTPADCPDQSAFCTRSVASGELGHGHLTLRVDSSALDPALTPPSLVVSIARQTEVTTYVTPVAVATPEQVLGLLILP